MEKEVIIIRGYDAKEVVEIAHKLSGRKVTSIQAEAAAHDAEDEGADEECFVEMEDGTSKAKGLSVYARPVGTDEWEFFKTLCDASEKIGIAGSTLSHKLRIAKGRLRYKGYEVIYATLKKG